MSLDGFLDDEVKPMEIKERNDIPNVDRINFTKEEWKKLNEEHTEGWIREWIVDTVRKNKIPPPYNDYTIEEVREDFEKLKAFDTSTLITDEKYYIKHDIQDKWNKPIGIMWKQNNTGNKSSNYFQQKSRFKADSTVSYGVEFTWNNNKLLYRTLNALWTLKCEKVNNTTLQSIMQLRGYIPSQFKPVVAKGIYDLYKARNVFDMSMGWGDRLAGAEASSYVKYYYGTDPNTNTFPDYKKQHDFYNTDTEIDIYNLPAEDLTEKPKYPIDVAFTSPPYFSKEKYSEDKQQSWKRYPKIDTWLKDFLFKAIKFQWDSLRKEGIMIVNISDVYIDGDWQVICDPMNEYISSLEGAEYQGHMGMKMTKRPNVHSAQEGNFAEPMWTWKKV